MAYATKYLFKWQSAKGTTREIRVLKNGYSGSVIQRALGRAPILKKQKNGTVFGTSLEFYAECQVEGEFTEFYTTNPKAYKVQLYAGNDLLWQGYVTPELYSEPDIAPPFDVQVIATDGIGELKLYDFEPQGTVTLRSIFTYLLGYTGLGTDVYLISSLKAGSSGAGALLEKTINLDYMAGESCYDVLTYLLDTLHATITWWKGAWIVARETNVTFTSGKVRYFNTAGNSALLAGSVQTLGKMYTNDVWPVGQLSRKVDPAKKSVTVQAPWHVVTAFVNSGMDSDSGWTKANNASFDSTKGAYYLPDNDPYQPNGLAEISQQISMLGLRVPMSFSGKFCATELPPFSGATYGGVVGVDVLYVTGNVSYYLTKDDNGDTVWKQGDGGKYDFQIRLSQVNTDKAGAEELTFEVPPLMLNNTYPSGTLTFHIVGRSALVFNAFLDIKISKGYQDRLHIDNGARGEEGEYEVGIGRETSDIDYYKAFMQGILLDSGSLITSFKDDAITTGMDFLAFISRDYARSFALPRIVRTGTVQLEAAVQFPPLVLTKAAVDYWLETWSWNMYEDELDITARSLPTASITVDSEVISEASGTTSGGSESGGGSSSMSGGRSNYFEPDDEVESAVALKAAYIAISAPDFLIGPDRESVTGDLEIIGAALQSLQAQIDSAASRDCFDELSATTFYAGMVASPDARFHEAHAARYYLTDSIYMEYVPGAGGNAGYVKLNAALVTSGDQIVNSGTPGGGGGGGIGYLYQAYDVSGSISVKPSARKLLVFNPEGTDKNGEAGAWEYEDIPEQAVTSVALSAGASNGTIHLVVNNVAQSDVAVKGLGSAAFQNTDAFAAAIHTHAISDVSGLNDNLLTISGALQSLQCQIDSVSARDCFDDLTASTIFADTLAASGAYIGEIAGHLTGNVEGTATNATYLVGSTFSKGGAATPVYFTGGQPAACSYSFGNASGNAALNNGALNVNLYAYRAQIDSDSENIASNMSTIGGCLKSIQSQIDSVGAKNGFDELYATAFFADKIAATSAFIETVTGDLTGTASRAKADEDGNTISSTYLKLSGGTMSGVLSLKANQYSGPSGNYGMNANNSDIVGLNAIYTDDLADDMAEGINFFRSSGHWDSLTSSNGVLYYYPNRPDATTAFANAYTIYHSGNANKSDVPWTCQYLTVNASPQTTYRAYVNGDIVSSGDQVITSDATKKMNWREVGYGVEDIARCTVGRFDWIDGHGTSVGTKAQDWRPLTPELVHGEEGDLNLAYGQIALVNTILIARHEYEQDEEIHRLRELVNELENEVRRLRS